MNDPTSARHVIRRHPVLGTEAEVVVRGRSESAARRIAEVVFAEFDRLEQILSAYRPDSELNEWKRDAVARPSPELCEVMVAATRWQARSGGAFNPLAGELSRRWTEAEREGVEPSDGELHEWAAAIRDPRVEIRDGLPHRVGDCTHLNLNAIAKGFIVDMALRAGVATADDASLLVSAGGDMAHFGDEVERVGIDDPLRPYDNEAPIALVALHDGGLATSGGARRGFRIGGRRYSHVIDPRTGRPVESQASITVVAPSAMEADVLATCAGVLDPADAVTMFDERDDAGCLVIDPSGRTWSDTTWRSREIVSPHRPL